MEGDDSSKKPCELCGDTGAIGGNDGDYNGPIRDCPNGCGQALRQVHGRAPQPGAQAEPQTATPA